MPNEKMLPADWLEYIQQQSREVARPPNPPKRRQPKVTRHMSREQRIALSQTRNPIRAMYGTESQYNQTPTRDTTFVGTKEVGPGDVNNSSTNWRTGNITVEPSINGNKAKPRPRRESNGGSKGQSKNLEDLLKEYGA